MHPFIWNQIRNALIAVVVLGVAFYSLNVMLGPRTEQTDAESAATLETLTLIENLRELKKTHQNELSAELLLIDERIALANKIIANHLDVDADNFAISEKLSALISREAINLELEQELVSDPFQLESLANQHKDSDRASISSQSHLLLSMAAITKYLQQEPNNQKPELRSEAVKQIQSIAALSGDVEMVADGVLDWLRLLNDKYDPELLKPLFEAFVSTFQESKSKHLLGLVASIQGNFENSATDLVDVKGGFYGTRQTLATKLVEQVKNIAEQPDQADQPTLLMAISRAKDLLAVSMADKAKQIRNLLAGIETGETSDNLRQQLDDLDRKIELFGTPFDLHGIKNVDESDVSFSSETAKFRLLFFTTPDASGNPVAHLKRILDAVRPALKNESLELAVVSVTSNSYLDDEEKKRQFVALAKNWHTWFFNTESEVGKQFLKRLSLNKLPYVVLLDQENNVISIGARPQIIQEFVFAIDSD